MCSCKKNLYLLVFVRIPYCYYWFFFILRFINWVFFSFVIDWKCLGVFRIVECIGRPYIFTLKPGRVMMQASHDGLVTLCSRSDAYISGFMPFAFNLFLLRVTFKIIKVKSFSLFANGVQRCSLLGAFRCFIPSVVLPSACLLTFQTCYDGTFTSLKFSLSLLTSHPLPSSHLFLRIRLPCYIHVILFYLLAFCLCGCYPINSLLFLNSACCNFSPKRFIFGYCLRD